MTENCGIDPVTTSDLAEALARVRADGAVIFDGVGITAEAAIQLGHDLYGEKVLKIPEAARVFEGGEQDRHEPLDHRKPIKVHTDGFAYGDHYPDVMVLSCANASAVGGESFLVDGYAVLDKLAASDESCWLVDALESVAVDQTEPDMQISHSTIVQYTRAGRKMLRRNFSQRPLAESANAEKDQMMIDAWLDAVDGAAMYAPRFRVEAGQAVIVDNYRALHAREGYEDKNRMMWRVWVWTDESLGPPDMPLHSDSRFAARDE